MLKQFINSTMSVPLISHKTN